MAMELFDQVNIVVQWPTSQGRSFAVDVYSPAKNINFIHSLYTLQWDKKKTYQKIMIEFQLTNIPGSPSTSYFQARKSTEVD